MIIISILLAVLFCIFTFLLLKNKLHNYSYAILVIGLMIFSLLFDMRTRISTITWGDVSLKVEELRDATEAASVVIETVRDTAIAQAKVAIPSLYSIPYEQDTAFRLFMIDAYKQQEQLLTNLKGLGVPDSTIYELRRLGCDAAQSQIFVAFINRVLTDKTGGGKYDSAISNAISTFIGSDNKDDFPVDKLITAIKKADNGETNYKDDLELLYIIKAFRSAVNTGTLEISNR